MSINLILRKFKCRDLASQYGAAVIVAIISFVISAAVARRIGPEQFGIFATALSIGAMLGIFLDFGFKQMVQREAARSSLAYSYRRLQGAAIANIVIVACLFVIGAFTLFDGYVLIAVSIAICFTGAAFTQLISAGLRGLGYFFKDAGHQVASRFISAAFILFSLLFHPHIPAILFAWGTGTVAWALYAFGRLSRPLPARPSLEIYGNALPLFIIDLLIVVHFRVDVVFMQYFDVDREFIGNFSAALRIVEVFIFLTFPLRSILLTQIRQETKEEAVRLLPVRCAMVATIALVLCFVTAIIAPFIIEVVFGKQFARAGDLLRILIWLLLPSFVLAIVFESSVAANLETSYKTAALLVLIVNLVSLTAVIHFGNQSHLAYLKVILETTFAALAFVLVYKSLKSTSQGM